MSSAIESCIELLSYQPNDLVTEASAELAALRQERDDLAMIVRASLPTTVIQRVIHTMPMDRDVAKWCIRLLGSNTKILLLDDGTGLPVLTPEARTALARK